MLEPSSSIDPLVLTIWQMDRSVVVLPAPLAPRTTTTSPRWTWNSTECSASICPYEARSPATRSRLSLGLVLISRTSVVSGTVTGLSQVGLDDLRVTGDVLRRAVGDAPAEVEDDDVVGDPHDHGH